MKITYCWTSPSGYLAASVGEVARRPGIDVTLVLWEPATLAPFDMGLFDGVRTHVLSRRDRDDPAVVREVVTASQPDVVVFTGWSHPPYVKLLDAPGLRRARFVMTADTAIRFDWRQRLAPLKIGGLLRRVDAVVVAGERGYLLMRSWGVPAAKITRGLYAIDYRGFAAAGAPRFDDPRWPRRFLFAGRYVPAKAIDVLVEAYRDYRGRVEDPWPLATCGAGPLAPLLDGVTGIENRGFLQPAELASALRSAGAFILPSRVEPWGQVVVEAAASGVPVIASLECGAGVEIVRDFHSGFLVPAEDPAATSRAMVWLHEHAERLPEMGRHAAAEAAAHSAERWADRQVALFDRLIDAGA